MPNDKKLVKAASDSASVEKACETSIHVRYACNERGMPGCATKDTSFARLASTLPPYERDKSGQLK
jgi:hypothetical protein